MLSRMARLGLSQRNPSRRRREFRPAVESLETRTLLSSNVRAFLLAALSSSGSDTTTENSAGTQSEESTSAAIDPSGPLRFDFGTATSAVADGFLQVTPSDVLSEDRPFGFLSTSSDISAKNRSGWWGDHSRDFVSGDRVTFGVRLHPGATYNVRYAFGDPFSSTTQVVTAEGVGLESVALRRRQYHSETRQVVVSDDGLLELTVAARSSRPALLNSLIITLVSMPPADTGDNDNDGSDTGGGDTGGSSGSGGDSGGDSGGSSDTDGSSSGDSSSGGDTGGSSDSGSGDSGGGSDTGDSGSGDSGGDGSSGGDTGGGSDNGSGDSGGGSDTGGSSSGDSGGDGSSGGDTGGDSDTDSGTDGTADPPAAFLDARTAIEFDFGTSDSAVAPGMIQVTPGDQLSDDELYGLVRTSSTIIGVNRNGWWGDHSRDYVAANRFDFIMRVLPGATYSVRYAFGDPFRGRTQTISAEGRQLDTVRLRARQYYNKTREVVVSDDGLLELSFASSSFQPALINSLVLKLLELPPDQPSSSGDSTDTDNSDTDNTDTDSGVSAGSDDSDSSGSDSDGSSGHSTDCKTTSPAWLSTFPSSNAPVFDPDQYAIDCSEQYVPGTNWNGLNEQQVFAQRITVASPEQQPAYEYRIGKGSQLYSLRLEDERGRWVDAIATQRRGRAEWVDEVIQTVIVDTDTNNRSSEATKNQIHSSGTYENINGVDTFYFPVLDEAWIPEQRSFSTISWPQQAHIPSNFKSHFLHMQQFRELGSGVLEVTYVYHNFSLEGEKATFLAAPWLPIRHSTFPYHLRSLPDGTIQRDQNTWCAGSSCGPTSVPINETGGYFVFSSGVDADDPAMAIVFGTDQNTEGQTAETHYRWGTVNTGSRDMTATSLQKRVRVEPGEVFYHRFYLVVNTLQNARVLAQQIESHVDQGFLTTDASAATDACFAMESGQLVPTDCADSSALVQASSTPRTDWQPLLTIVDNSTGKRSITNDPYLFMRRTYRQEYEVDGILGWVAPDTIATLAASQDPDVMGLFSLREP